ncbi:hypothetical protein TSAR_012267 [Trichomalopsis sarcophagae]|uniref:C2H2-type domain-containing protein n=1 Tax=Trichomalopsis sarcophagae TaxID=543379 RepID=A0A232FNV3_9HYME|nr:hypothetical protein TSAR_012267 [Trichomalopsis sarcophagae]
MLESGSSLKSWPLYLQQQVLMQQKEDLANSIAYKVHPNERKCYECLTCQRRFSQKTTITRHLRYFCGKGHRYKCPYCDALASCSSNIYRHVRSRHDGKMPHAIKLFTSITDRLIGQRSRRHVYSIKKSYYCPRCNHGYTEKANMIRHFRHECGVPPKYQCPYCTYPSKYTHNIYAHFTDSSFSKDQPPTVTLEALNQSYWKPMPQQQVPLVRYYYCPCCNHRYTNKANMLKHYRHVCGRPPQYKCPHCEYISRYAHNVYAHVRRVHPSEKPSFTHKTHLTRITPRYKHDWLLLLLLTDPLRLVPRYTLETPGSIYRARGKFRCDICGKSYKWYSGLYRHKTYECGKLPRFQCPHCEYVAKQRPHVYSHIKSAHKNSAIYALDLEISEGLASTIISNGGTWDIASTVYQTPTVGNINDVGPLRFACPYCQFRNKRKDHIYRHIRGKHPSQAVCYIDLYLHH